MGCLAGDKWRAMNSNCQLPSAKKRDKTKQIRVRRQVKTVKSIHKKMPHKAKRNLPSSTPSTSTLTANNRRTAAAGHTYLALDHGLNDNHLGGAMHFLNLAGYGMTHARVEPHQIPLGPVHVAMLLLCSTVHSLLSLSVGPTSISVITSHLVPFVDSCSVSTFTRSTRLVSSRLVLAHTDTAGSRKKKRGGRGRLQKLQVASSWLMHCCKYE